jgi:GTP-binding nuclear protein Ran
MGGVGKAAFVGSLIGEEFNNKYVPTLGCEVKYLNFGSINFKIFDTAGVKKYRGLDDGYASIFNCAIVVYDIFNKKSYDYAKIKCDKLMKFNKIPFILVANNTNRPLKTRYTKKSVIEICAKSGTNVEIPILELIKLMNL